MPIGDAQRAVYSATVDSTGSSGKYRGPVLPQADSATKIIIEIKALIVYLAIAILSTDNSRPHYLTLCA